MKNRLLVRLLSLVAVAVMSLSFAACKKNSQVNNQQKPTEVNTVSEATKDSADKTESPTQEESPDARTPRNIAESVIAAMWVDFDAKKAYELSHPATVVKACEVTGLSEEEYIALLQNTLDTTKQEMEDAGGTAQCTILKENPLDQERLTELTSFYAEIDLEIQEVSVVLVDNKFYEGNEEVGQYIQEITCAKIDNEWYLVDFGVM